MSYKISFDKDVYSDANLNNIADMPLKVDASTQMPAGVYFTPNQTYVGTACNKNDDILYTVTFTTDNILDGNIVTIESGAQYM